MQPFNPDACFKIAANSTGATLQKLSDSPGPKQVRFKTTAGSSDVYFAFGDASVEASAASHPSVLGGSVEIFSTGCTHISVRSASGSVTVEVTLGNGE